ncbi:hypothetical protein DET49_10772 [Salegentibacter sp. 24]|uniref:hypothetical protein n=1 Tax=Salegentibacter sp. 24 TaxID=2183986 RepID=UPI00106236D9|nr:hypothetical protein [Salegentibacter sp. 24]TDN89156.1 hypothetical protein DET49_10772 [Salegentibacter sp. 24]
MKLQGEIAIVTTVNNWELYRKTSHSFPPEVIRYVIDGRNRFYGLKSLLFILKKLRTKNLTWLIMVDEDAVVSSAENLFALIHFMSVNNYTACGMRDGGEIKWRNFSPHSINTFCSILNLKDIYKIFDQNEILQNQFIRNNEFSWNLENLKYKNYRRNSLFEEYYCFFFWLLRKNKKIYYLKANNPYHDETTALMNHNNKVFLYHAWYSRFYGKDEKHTHRINKMIELGEANPINPSPLLLKNPAYKLRFLAYKYYRRFLRKFL